MMMPDKISFVPMDLMTLEEVIEHIKAGGVLHKDDYKNILKYLEDLKAYKEFAYHTEQARHFLP
jgi:hypothetical protein